MGVSTASGVYCETSMPRKLTPFPSLANPLSLFLSLSPSSSLSRQPTRETQDPYSVDVWFDAIFERLSRSINRHNVLETLRLFLVARRDSRCLSVELL